MPYVLMHGFPGQPIVALRADEPHYNHIQQGERVSLVVFPLVPKTRNPKDLPLPKMNMTADCKAIVEPDFIHAILDKYSAFRFHAMHVFSSFDRPCCQ